MSEPERLIFDTNVLVSALLSPQSVPRRAFDMASRQGTLLASEATLLELARTLHKPKLSPYITPVEREAFLHAYADQVEMVSPTETVSICRDPRDNMFLELVIAGSATWLITGDNDLLTLGSFQTASIAAPTAYLET